MSQKCRINNDRFWWEDSLAFKNKHHSIQMDVFGVSFKACFAVFLTQHHSPLYQPHTLNHSVLEFCVAIDPRLIKAAEWLTLKCGWKNVKIDSVECACEYKSSTDMQHWWMESKQSTPPKINIETTYIQNWLSNNYTCKPTSPHKKYTLPETNLAQAIPKGNFQQYTFWVRTC